MIKRVLILVVFLISLSSCKKDFGEAKNLSVKSYYIPENLGDFNTRYIDKTIVFNHNENIFLFVQTNYINLVYSFDPEKEEFKYEYEFTSEYTPETFVSCDDKIYMLTAEKSVIDLNNDFTHNKTIKYNDDQLIDIFSFNNLLFLTRKGLLTTYNPATGVLKTLGNIHYPVKDIIEHNNKFYCAAGRTIFESDNL